MLKLVEAGEGLAVEVSRAKQRLRIDTSDFDEDLAVLSAAAQGTVEKETGLTLRRSSWEYRVDGWPCGVGLARFDGAALTGWPVLSIPAAPIRDVTAIKYLDSDDVEQTVNSANYSWARTREGADITFAKTFTLPLLSTLPQAVRISFDAGFDDPDESGAGDDPELTLPPRAEMAILFLVAHWHSNISPVIADTRAAPYKVPNTFEYLAQQLRIYR